MFVVLIDYTASLTGIDQALPDHAVWLDEQYAARRFLASGRREPRTGGVVLATGASREEIEQVAASDPFAVAGLATHTVVEFHPSRAAAGLDALL